MSRVLAWVDGVNSAVMCHLALQDDPGIIPVHCEMGTSVDPDSHRFINDLELWYGKPIVRIKSAKYDDIDALFEARKYHSGINGAPCTSEMKVAPRLDYQLPSDTHLWGYTADKTDVTRWWKMLRNYPLMTQYAPLIEKGMTKARTHALLADAGIKRPAVYEIGYPNGNCIGCVKASSPDYWAATRRHYPDVFARRADQSRRFGSRLTRINNVRIFIDEIPEDWPTDLRGIDIEPCGLFGCAA